MQTIPSPSSPGFRLTPQAVLGAIIVVFGLLLTADNFDLLEADKFLRFWPMVFVAVGLTKLVQSDTTFGQVFGGGLAGIGVLMIVDEFWTIDLDLDRMWPLALVAVGAFIVYRAARGETSCGAPGPATADNQVSEFAFWSGKIRRNASSGFRRADLTAIMGGVELDLRGASTPNGQEAIIDVFVWGGGWRSPCRPIGPSPTRLSRSWAAPTTAARGRRIRRTGSSCAGSASWAASRSPPNPPRQTKA